MNQRTIREKTLQLLLGSVKSCEDLEVVEQAIEDYHQTDGTDYSEYKQRVSDLRHGCR
ncbi:MAG TPA: hypothetical protein VMC80_02950 [Patescibacteria group bacterium]|nr:hypothetical protein [Patescibacteria group bacterium]